jgi:ferritin-like metal-binding protein YciE
MQYLPRVRLEQVFSSIDTPPKGKTCGAILGILEEGNKIMEEYGMPALDVGLPAAAQAVEHYEMSRYGTLKTLVGELGNKEAVAHVNATLTEEKTTDQAKNLAAESLVSKRGFLL